MILTDTHTHLYSDKFADDRIQMIERAVAKGVHRLFMPNIDNSSIEGMMQLVEKYPNHCFPMMGLHPCSVDANVENELNIVKQQLADHSFCAVGEIGIDLYWDKTFLSQQEFAFRKQIEWAKELNLPIVIHCREAFDEILAILDEVNDDNLKGIFHCFTGNIEQAKHIIGYEDFYLGIGGVVTFKKAGLDKVVEQLSINHLVLETDSPYLAPSPYRGKRNESAYLLNVAVKVAELLHLPIEEVAAITTKNSIKIFGK
ncbi:TatD family hydrolase [Acidiluteibacter ferrifornacis]|uniref:YchF/TatD family DNA exonuclease n=1 Tax=Acidiluteibacter ferrifornacis TaxID=2692424 RepID=A0A6N9NH92_9FLAO|nr:TatD family hydrolase [Acidiluteibacter ferrifornacis]NBG65194.1 YchF/TatD family DNA exonuclease [Acidiluteibacter ferrifornacis]